LLQEFYNEHPESLTFCAAKKQLRNNCYSKNKKKTATTEPVTKLNSSNSYPRKIHNQKVG